MSDMNVISVSNVSKNFKLPHEKVDSVKGLFVNPFGARLGSRTETQHALKDISFDVKRGEFFGIVGRNGSGKSTLLKIIAGIYQPTRGKVGVNGRLVPFIELGVGFNPELSGRENVYLNGALMGFADKEIDAKLADIIEFAELGRFMDQKLKNYSSGMQVRLAFSVATILADSEILLIDEVLAVGDADFQRKCFRYFQQLKKDKKTVIFVTHDMGAVREYCDRVVLIEKSRLTAMGRPDDIAQQYERMMQPKDDKVKNDTDSSERWGDGLLKVETVSILDNSDTNIKFQTDIVATDDCADPTIGFTIRNRAGVILMGTNTTLNNNQLPAMKKGEKVSVVWDIANALSDGDYSLSVAAQYDRGATNGDWWGDAAKIRVVRNLRNPFPIYPQVRTKQRKV